MSGERQTAQQLYPPRDPLAAPRALSDRMGSNPEEEQLHCCILYRNAGKHGIRKVFVATAQYCVITYLLRHWKGLTAFLRHAGAPLDNNICEQALKRAVLHRKNALFYKNNERRTGGDLFMTLIHTCQLCGANSFDYLTELLRHAGELAAYPAEWMPWNYSEKLGRL
jgi:hypothetical protein